MPERPAKFADLLQVLDEYGVEYVLVGALAAVFQGAPVSTFDIDIVHRRDPKNLVRLAAALRSIHAYYWEHMNRRIEPDEHGLARGGHHLLDTDFGHIDVLGTIGGGRGYEELVGRAAVIAIGARLRVRVLDLEAVIETKREAARPKDLAALPVLEQTLAESRRHERADENGLQQDRLAVCPLRDLPPNRKRAFYAWVEGMTHEADNEDGPGFAAWFRHHETVPGDTAWVFTDRDTGGLLGTASLVKRDQDTEADEGGWVIGGVNVVRERRREGIGAAIMRFLEDELQRRAREAGLPIPVKLDAVYPPAIRLYESFGFRRVPGTERVFGRVYEAE